MPQVKVSRQKLQSALSACTRITPSRTPKEILKLARVTYDGAKLTLAATDSEIAISIDIECDGDGKSFDVLADPVILRGLIAGADEVQLKVDGTTLVVECGGTGRIETSDAAEFPPMPMRGDGERITVDAEQLAAAINRASVACDISATSYALGGVHFDAEAGDSKIHLVATDSSILVVCPVAATSSISNPISVVVPLKSCKAIAGSIGSGQVEIVFTDNAIFIECENTRFSSNLLQGRFPKWRKVIPAKFAFEVNLLASAVKDACAKASLFATEESYGLDLNFKPGELVISRNIDKGGFSHSIPHDNIECDLHATLCHSRLSKAIGPSDSMVEVLAIDAESPFVIVDGENTAVIMPLSKDR